ncbi:queuosine precursor transporter [Natrialbaceae archaeon A-gly3]
MSQTQTRVATPTIAQVTLIGLFVTALVTAQLTASKVLGFSIPFSLPVTGAELVLPGAALAYALTFLASDCYAELYGRRAATIVVNVGFVMNFVVLLLVWSTIAAPDAGTGVPGDQFATVLGASTNVVLGSLLAYIVSQNWDVWLFHEIRDRTGPGKLWLRNIVSTGTSQAIDTVIFVSVAFAIAPALLGVGEVLVLEVVLGLIVGQYLLKLAIAVLDTPFVYLVVSLVRSRREAAGDPSTA